MKFTKLEIAGPLNDMVSKSIDFYRRAPDNQKEGIRMQVAQRMLAEIKRQGKIYLVEEKAYKDEILQGVKTCEASLAKGVKDLKDLQALKHKPKNEAQIKALHTRIDQTYMFVGAQVGEMNASAQGLTDHQGWRGEAIPDDADAQELLGGEISRLDGEYKKIREMGVGIIASLKAPRQKADQILARCKTMSEAAKILAAQMLDAGEVADFATKKLDELHAANSGDVAKVEQVTAPMDGYLDMGIDGLSNFLKNKKAITAKELEGQRTFHQRNFVTRGGQIRDASLRTETIKATCDEIARLAKKARLPADLATRLKDTRATVKQYEKTVAALQKKFDKYQKLVEKDLVKAVPAK